MFASRKKKVNCKNHFYKTLFRNANRLSVTMNISTLPIRTAYTPACRLALLYLHFVPTRSLEFTTITLYFYNHYVSQGNQCTTSILTTEAYSSGHCLSKLQLEHRTYHLANMTIFVLFARDPAPSYPFRITATMQMSQYFKQLHNTYLPWQEKLLCIPSRRRTGNTGKNREIPF